jgi:hypothetical protein
MPPHELNAHTVKPPAEDTDRTELSIFNAGPTDLSFGYGYSIYRKEPAGWKVVPIELAVPAIGMNLKPADPTRKKFCFTKSSNQDSTAS